MLYDKIMCRETVWGIYQKIKNQDAGRQNKDKIKCKTNKQDTYKIIT